MAGTAMVPCIKCGAQLQNVEQDCENQPYKGTAFTSYGHYGSTAFDPMNGSMIEINLCDDCLTTAGKENRVLWIRNAKAIMYDGSIIGWLTNRGTHYVEWKPELDETDGLRTNEQHDLERISVDSREDLVSLMKGNEVKLNGSLTIDDIFGGDDVPK